MSLELPLHPLFAHAPVVLLPLTVLGVFALLFMKRRSAQLVYALLGLVVAAVVSTVATLLSGNVLADVMGFNPATHQRWGLYLTIAAVVYLLVAGPWLWLVAKGGQQPKPITKPLGFGAAAVGLAVLVFTFLAGHSGAEMAWSGIGSSQETPVATASPAPSATQSSQPAQSTPEASNPSASAATGYTAEMVAEHATADDCWVIISGQVYDLTEWVSQHPGGSGSITSMCGKDSTASFEGKHGGESGPAAALEQYLLGPLN